MGTSKNRFKKENQAGCTHYAFGKTLLLGRIIRLRRKTLPTKQGCMPAFCAKRIMRRGGLTWSPPVGEVSRSDREVDRQNADGVHCLIFFKQGF